MKKLTLTTLFALSAVSLVTMAEGENTTKPAAEAQPQTSVEVKPAPVKIEPKDEINKALSLAQPEKMPKDAIHQGMQKDEKKREHIIFMKDMPMAYHCGGKMGKHHQAHKGGFLTTKEASKVSDAAQWQDDQIIFLEGNIMKQVGKNDFIFKDDSGELTLEIHKDAWLGKTITPEEKVRIVAEVEKSWGKTEVEAVHIMALRGDKWGKKSYHSQPVPKVEIQPAVPTVQ